MGDNLGPNGFEGLQGFLLQVEVSEIVVHEAGEPNAVIDLLDAEFLAGQYGGNVDPLAMQAEAIPLDLRNLGRRMHGLPRWRPRGSAGSQVQIRDYGSLPARAKAREATRPHEGLGAIRRRIERHPLWQNRLIYLRQRAMWE